MVRDSVATGSTTYGASAGFSTGTASTAELNLTNCAASHNNYGVYASYGTIYINASTITDNFIGLGTGTLGQIYSLVNNMVRNNTSADISPTANFSTLPLQ
jgi:hypothetical protein